MTRKQIKGQAARYAKFVEWSDEGQCFIGRCPELIHTDGQEMPAALGAKKFSGRFVLRVEPALHRRLAAKALAAGESLNSFCARTLCKR